jgi:hypothetical protein
MFLLKKLKLDEMHGPMVIKTLAIRQWKVISLRQGTNEASN